MYAVKKVKKCINTSITGIRNCEELLSASIEAVTVL